MLKSTALPELARMAHCCFGLGPAVLMAIHCVIAGTLSLYEGQVSDLLAGLWYVETELGVETPDPITTPLERGQILPDRNGDGIPDSPGGGTEVRCWIRTDAPVSENWHGVA